MFKKSFEGFCYYLLYGGISYAACEVLAFILRAALPYFFYKEETINACIQLIRWLLFIVLYGLKYVEHQGYFHEEDHAFSLDLYRRQMLSISGLVMVIPALVSINRELFWAFIWSIFYPPVTHLANFLNQWMYGSDEIHSGILIMGTAVIVGLNILLLLPFYYLGRRNRRLDIAYKKSIHDNPDSL